MYQKIAFGFTNTLTRFALQIVEETLPALEELRREGLVRHIGITGLPLKVFRSVLDRWRPFAVTGCCRPDVIIPFKL